MGRGFTFPGYEARFTPRPGYLLTHASIEIWINPEEKTLEGVVEYKISSGERARRIELDASEMEILEVLVDGEPVEFRYTGEKLVIPFTPPLTRRVRSLVVKYRVVEPRYGLYFIDEPPMVYTQGETIWTSYWLPTYREPNMRLSFDMTIHAPAEWRAFSNGVLVSAERRGEESIWRYSFSYPVPTYLIAFAAGRFSVAKEDYRGVQLEYIVAEGEEAKIEPTFRMTRDMMRFFEEWLGVQYPYPVYRQVMVRDFVVGGMENVSITILNDATLMDEHSKKDFRVEDLLSHELAHQWFGDLVTCRDWSQIWINEGFATFLNLLYIRHWLGMDEYVYSLLGVMDRYLEETRRYTRPTVYRVYRYPEELFDRHVYERGALILNMLMNLLGEDIFRKAVKKFLNRYRFQNVDTEDLRKTFEEVSGEDLDWFFETFVYNAGHMELEVSVEPLEDQQAVRIDISQRQGEDMPEVYKVPIELEAVGDGWSIRRTYRLEKRDERIIMPVRRGFKYVLVDPDFKLMARIRPKYPLDMLGEILLGSKSTYWRLLAARALGEKKGKRVVDLLVEAIRRSGFYGVAKEAAVSLGLEGSDYAKKRLRELLEEDLHPRVRAALVRSLGGYRDEGDAQLFIEILRDTREPYGVRAEAAHALGKTRHVDGIEVLRSILDEWSYAYVVQRYALRGLAEYDDDEAFQEILSRSRPGNPLPIRVEAITQLGRYPERKEVYRALDEYASDRHERVRRAVVAAARQLMNRRALPIIEKILRDEANGFIAKACLLARREIEEALEKGEEYKRLIKKLEEMETWWRDIYSRIEVLDIHG